MDNKDLDLIKPHQSETRLKKLRIERNILQGDYGKMAFIDGFCCMHLKSEYKD